MDRDKYIKVGRLVKIHGYRGDMILRSEPEFMENLTGAEMVFIEIEGLLAPFFISPDNIKQRDANSIFIKFDDVDSDTRAKEFTGSDIYMPGTKIKNESEELIFQKYINYNVVDQKYGDLGTIKSVINVSSNPILQIFKEEKEILVPAQELFVISTDNKNRQIIVDLPAGLIDIYI